MDQFVGTWKLEKNINFEEFLIYFNYSWVKRKLALASNIDLTIKKIDKNHFKRIINSTFLKSSEDYMFDNQFHTNEQGLEKSHNIIENEIHTQVKNNNIQWTELNKIIDSKLVITRKWIDENGKIQKCSQIFIKIN